MSFSAIVLRERKPIAYQFTELDAKEYSDFVIEQKSNNFLQSQYNFIRYKNKNREVYLLGLRKNKRIVLAVLVVVTQQMLGKKIFSAPGGPIVNYDRSDIANVFNFFFKKCKSFLNERSGLVLQISPYIPYSKKISRLLEALHFKNLGEYIQAKWLVTRSFSGIKSDKELLADFSVSHRRCVKYALNRYDIKIRELDNNHLDILTKLVNMSAKKHNFIAYDQKIYEDFILAFGDHVKVLAAFYCGVPISAALFIIYGDEVIYLYGGNDQKYMKMCGSYAIQWYMIKYCLDHKILRYNFFGTKPVNGNGVFEFKKGFHGKVLELQGSYMLPLNILGRLYTMRKKYRKYGDVL